jgi:hypothetical protein
MNNDRWGRTPGEIDDDDKHFYAKSTVRLRAVVDDLSEIAQKVDGKTRLELKRLRAQLVSVYQLIGYHTVFEMDNADTYSDCTPVSIVVGPPSSRDWSAPEDVYDCGIPWNPNMADGYDADGPVPPGCEVMVVDPPHQRKSTARAARQDVDLGIRSAENPPKCSGRVRTS